MWSALVNHGSAVGVKLRDCGTVEEPLIGVEVFSESNVRDDFDSQICAALGGNKDITGLYELAKSYPYLKKATTDFYGLKACEDDHSLF